MRAGSTELGSVPAVVLRGGAHYVAGLLSRCPFLFGAEVFKVHPFIWCGREAFLPGKCCLQTGSTPCSDGLQYGTE